jgi:hypothetical protein
MIEAMDSIREAVEECGVRCYLSHPETRPEGGFAVLSVTSSVPRAVDADGVEYITTTEYNLHLYTEGSQRDSLSKAEEVAARLSLLHIRRTGLSGAYSSDRGTVYRVLSFEHTMDERGIGYMER